MPEAKTYPILPEAAKHAYIDEAKYQAMYQQSINNPEQFWGELAKEFLAWQKPWQQVLQGGFDKLDAQWFQGGKLNACYNCVDRHLIKRGDKPAILWQGDEPNATKKITYRELHEQVCRLANVLKGLNVKKGDRVCIYMPMIPEAIVAMLACARMGAIHSVVFAGFSAHSLKNRIEDSDCQIIITANEGLRGGKIIPLKQNVDEALDDNSNVRTVIVVQHTKNKVQWYNKRDVWYHDVMTEASSECAPEMMDANDPLFILYTSGSTGKPKGIQHSTGGYLLYAAVTHKYVFDYHEDDIYWCAADIGWVTGHTYTVYGPLANGATIVLFEGVPHYPTPARCWQIIDKFAVSIFYTSPTAIRALRREGDKWVTETKRKSLRLLGSVGEPINPEAWEWYYHIVGEDHCPIVDTWWQTETGGILISPLPGATPLKPGSATRPLFGIVPDIVNPQGQSVPADTMGELVITKPWPGMLQTIYNNRERFIQAYFVKYPGKYFTGDNALRDKDGYFWVAGRSDDVIKVSGHRIGTQEVESALLEHNAVSEAAVVAKHHDVKGECIYAFVSLKNGNNGSDQLKKELINTVRHSIGAIAIPEYIQWADNLPKTRSGKIMRRLLRKIANHETEDLGDISTLADPGVIKDLIADSESAEKQ